MGNILVEYRAPRAKRSALCFQAHMDHPGFEFVAELGRGVGRAEAFGGVPEKCSGAKLIFYSRGGKGRPIPAKVISFTRKGERAFIKIRYSGKLSPGAFAMWDQPAFLEKGDWIEGRGFDDCLGSAILVSLLEEAVRKKYPIGFHVLFTRAEEVGYNSALELMRSKSLRLPSNIVTVEMPRASKTLVAGAGVMVRAGDKMMEYTPITSRFIASIARKHERKFKWFRWQRSLGLLGGTECTVFQLHGYNVGAICLPVVHAHNRHETSGRPVPEKVHRRDLLSLWEVLVSLAKLPFEPEREIATLRTTLFKQGTRYRRKLIGSANG